VATKSILKNVHINDRKLARGLASALENAENKSSKDVVLKKRLNEVKGEDIKHLFGVK